MWDNYKSWSFLRLSYHNMGNCQNYCPFLGPYYNTGPNTGPNLGVPKRDHNFDNSPYELLPSQLLRCCPGISEGKYRNMPQRGTCGIGIAKQSQCHEAKS